MRKEVKAKIEAMAGKATPMIFDGMEKSLIVFMLQNEMVNPWAEWCERLTRELHFNGKYYKSCGDEAYPEYHLYHSTQKLLKEYRHWLEER